jgi:Zn-dependent protease
MAFTDAPATQSDRKISVIFWVLLAVLATSGWALWTGWGNAKFGTFLFVIAGWLVSLCLHEYAHARTALHSGDISIGAKGYLTLNPLKYTHPIYSFVMPVVFLVLGGIAMPGGAVFIERGRISGKWKHSAISAAGPAVNLAFGLVLLLVLGQVSPYTTHVPFFAALGCLALFQIMAGILNLVPMPGMDGYGIIEPWLSPANRRAFANIAPYGMMILFLLLWNPTIYNWFFNTVLAGILDQFGYSAFFAGTGLDTFQIQHFSLGSIFGS